MGFQMERYNLSEELLVEYTPNGSEDYFALEGILNHQNTSRLYRFLSQKGILPQFSPAYDDGIGKAIKSFYFNHHIHNGKNSHNHKKIILDLTKVTKISDLSPAAISIQIAEQIGLENLVIKLNSHAYPVFKLIALEKKMNIEVIN
jgi:hypothetical protein